MKQFRRKSNEKENNLETGTERNAGMCVNSNSTSGDDSADNKSSRSRIAQSRPDQCNKNCCNAGTAICIWNSGKSVFPYPGIYRYTEGKSSGGSDARYATTSDGGGLDTIASVSTDNGKTWNYSFPLYFPDSEGYSGTSATTIIDPALVQGADGAIYCIADVNPTGITTLYTSPGEGTGYVKVNGVDRLAVTDDYNNASKQPTDSDKTTYLIM